MGLGKLTVMIYAALATATVVALIFLVPPLNGPDEGTHFLRAVQIARHHLIGERLSPTVAGAMVDPGAKELAFTVLPMLAPDLPPDAPSRKFSRQMIHTIRPLHWSATDRAPVALLNTANYAPTFYFPAAAAIKLSQLANGGVLEATYAARLFGAIIALALATAALAIARRGRALMLLVLALPMTLDLFASITQDGLMIASCALAVALLGRLPTLGSQAQWRTALLAAALIGLIGAGRPPYIGLALLPGLVWLGLPRFGGERAWPRALALVLLPVAITLGWVIIGVRPVMVEFASGGPVPISIAAQLHGLLADPARLLSVLTATARAHAEGVLLSGVGILGNLDVTLPQFVYNAAPWLLLIALLSDIAAGSRRGGRGHPLLATMILLVLALTIVGLTTAFYLNYTPVGAAAAEGLQGRYFLPLLLCAGLALPPAGFGPARQLAGRVGVAAAGLMLCAGLYVIPLALLNRYYW